MLRWGLLSTENAALDGGAVGGNPLDQALWKAPDSAKCRAEVAGYARVATLPFDHDRQMVSVLVRDSAGRSTLVTKGAPETVLDRCDKVPSALRTALATEFACQWIDIRGFDHHDEKSEQVFPQFASLRGAMYEESVRSEANSKAKLEL